MSVLEVAPLSLIWLALSVTFVLGANRKRYFAVSAAVLVLLALAISPILDIDRPRTGSVTVSSAPFESALRRIQSFEHGRTVP